MVSTRRKHQYALRERTLACEVVVEVVKPTDLGSDDKMKVDLAGIRFIKQCQRYLHSWATDVEVTP